MSNEIRKHDIKVADASSSKRKHLQEGQSSDDDSEIVNVDFEWFDPQEIDFHGIKLLLRQLFDVDSELFDLSALSDLIISQPHLGSTVKVTDEEVETQQTDPFAFLTVLNSHIYRNRPELKVLMDYITSKCSSTPSLSKLGQTLVSSQASQVSLILCERFINMPPQIAPPMYKMLLEEIRLAMERDEQFKPTHFLIMSKSYVEIPSKFDNDNESEPRKKRTKDISQPSSKEAFYFHAEDEAFQKCALAYGNFDYNRKGADGASDAKRAFQDAGIEPKGHLILIEAGGFEMAVKSADEYINSGGS